MPEATLEADVIARAISRDLEAFTELYRKHAARILRHINYLVGDHYEADDLTNETFFRAWQVIHRYEDRGIPFENWLLKIGHNLASRHLKSRKPTRDIEDLNVEAGDEVSPERITETASEAEFLKAAILELPEPQRQVVIWRFLEDMSYEEVEAMLGKSNGAIRVIQYRALKQLRAILEAKTRAHSPEPNRAPFRVSLTQSAKPLAAR
jgi:RNA polymerase sigma-70 factor (ECF subfamily)